MPPAPQRASSHPSTSTSASTSHPSTRTSVRRNLFQSQLSRRGGESMSSSHTHSRSTSQSSLSHHRPTTSSTSTSAETLRLDIDLDVNRMGPEPTDIVIRDKNGDFEVLAMQSLEDDDSGGGEGGFRGMGEEGEEGEHAGVEERQRLADAVKHHQRDRNRAPSEPADRLAVSRCSLCGGEKEMELRMIYEAVRASLRAKTAALAEDNWMFEAEPETVIR
ncbi:upf0220 domain protein [Rutstroemia sp. NJR-2017a BVV2]|nr:upf0220 domain protein [Rutstroemia sp. NJR-2017a BVV2]